MTLFTFLFCLLSTLFVLLLFIVWRSSPVFSQQSQPIAEWNTLLTKRDEIEHDPTLSPTLKDSLREEWASVADKIMANGRLGDVQAMSMPSQLKWMLVIAGLLCGLAMYLSISKLSPEALQWPPARSEASIDVTGEPPMAEGAKHPGDNESLEQRIAKLEGKLKQNPNDVDGWVLLARSRGAQRDFVGEEDALRHALKLVPDHPDLMADLADTVAMVNGKSLAGEPMTLIAKVLKEDPKHRKGLALAATAAMQNRDKAGAINYWRQLRATYPENAPDVSRVDEILAELGEPITPKSTTKEPAQTALSNAVIEGDVSLDKALLSQVKQPLPPSATLFVFAKMESGPPMPLAVMRSSPATLLTGATIPFKLDDSMAMSPAMKLSNSPSVNLEARISLSGNAIKQSGDLYVAMPSVKVGTSGLHLVIQSTVK